MSRKTKAIVISGNGTNCEMEMAYGCKLGGFDQVIPLDEVIAAMDAVGRRIPSELRCTAQGGLSVTSTAKEIEKRLKASG